MEQRTVYIESDSTDPAYNLALEQYVFDCMPRDRSYFWLWQNDNAIVVGKYQNTMQEINQEYVKAHQIKVVRRLSGGGAVYHDMGNVNFTFIADAGNLEELNLQKFCIPVVKTLEKIGVHADLSGRNDISIDGKKFSGNSQYIRQGRILHHGTLMFDSDLSVVSQALNVSRAKFESKGFKSVKSRVTNIKPYVNADFIDFTMEEFRQILKNNMVGSATENSDEAVALGDTDHPGIEVYRLSPADEAQIRKIKQERYDTWEWNFGASPEYEMTRSQRFEGCGQLELFLKVDGGVIQDIQIYGDFFGDGLTVELKNCLIGCPLRRECIEDAIADFPLERCFQGIAKSQFTDFVTEN